MLYRLSYVRIWTAGLEPATAGSKKEPLPAPQADSILKVRDNCSGIVGLAARPRFERGPPGSGPGVVPVPPPRNGLDGRARTSTPRLPKPVRSRCATSSCVSTDGRIRTDTGGGLSAVPLPGLGYVSVGWWTVRGSNPRPSPCRGAALPVAPPAQGWWQVRGSNPPGEGYGPSLITRSPAVRG